MTWIALANTVPQYENLSGAPYSGAVLKAYEVGTTTPKLLAFDANGTGATVNGIVLNSSGYPAPSGNVVIPYVQGNCKLSLYPTQADANANTNAIWMVDNIRINGDQIISVKDYGAVGDGIADDTAEINAAITALNALGRKCLLKFTPGDKYLITAPITLKPNVLLDIYGSTIVYNGAANGAVFTSATTGVLNDAGIVGALIAADDAGTTLELFSPYACVFRDIAITGVNVSNYALDIRVNNSGGLNAVGNRNAAINEFENITHHDTCGTFLRLRGEGPTNGPPVAVVTLNTFHNIVSHTCKVRGIEFAEWADNNYFSGITRVRIDANNGVGVEYNTADPVGNRGVYANSFAALAVDTFGVWVGRIGVKMNHTKLNTIGYLHQDPQAEGGAVVVDPVNTQSYSILWNPQLTSNLALMQRNAFYKDNLFIGNADTATHYLRIGQGRTGNAYSHIDLVGDTTYVDYAVRLIRDNTGANANSNLTHRGTGSLRLIAENAGAVQLEQGSNVRVKVDNNGIGFFAAVPIAKPTITGAKGGNAALADLLTKLVSYGLIVDSTT